MTRADIIGRALARHTPIPADRPCTTWACRVLGVAPGTPAWQAVQIVDPARPWSAAQHHGGWWPGCMRPGPEAPTPGGVYLCQGWRRLTADGRVVAESSGHTWLWVTHPQLYWQGVVLHSSEKRGPRAGSVPLTVETTPADIWASEEVLPHRGDPHRYTSGVAWARVG